MRDKNCNRRKALKEELIDDWDKMNIATKSLVFVGMILFITSIFITIYSKGNEVALKSIEVVFRSSLASVFGFILSSNMKTSKINKASTQNNIMRNECEEEIIEHNYKEGNMIQIFIALTICIVSIITILTIYVLDITHNIVAITQLRDLMCSAIGFLLGESSIKK